MLFSDKHVTIQDILDSSKDSKIKMLQQVAESEDQLELNYKLMQLHEVQTLSVISVVHFSRSTVWYVFPMEIQRFRAKS